MSGHTLRAAIGAGVDDSTADRARAAAARNGCADLLRAQLRAGAHILPATLARRLGGSVGLHAVEVRASTDTSRKTKGSIA
jgi:hypothetical protein